MDNTIIKLSKRKRQKNPQKKCTFTLTPTYQREKEYIRKIVHIITTTKPTLKIKAALEIASGV
jgi:hypothetical protein